ncbi:hypothetical protein [Fluviibacterium sp. S390]|uniref:hypothetical protein n=1 Tax=Fluviibacterium sp. S390 TaxID=3415139 RepID=UPI003C7DBB7C
MKEDGIIRPNKPASPTEYSSFSLSESIVRDEVVIEELDATPSEMRLLAIAKLPSRNISLPVYGGNPVTYSNALDVLEAKLFLYFIREGIDESRALEVSEEVIIGLLESDWQEELNNRFDCSYKWFDVKLKNVLFDALSIFELADFFSAETTKKAVCTKFFSTDGHHF